jgi:bifunctional DNA-binding transcriptional regulator/antitoxin component of YhaV-PrlF toxin-antitoxin module
MAMPTVSITIEKDGRIEIPKRFRKALNLKQNQSVTVRQVGKTLLIEGAETSERRQRAEVIVRQAKISAARDAAMTQDEGWAEFKAAASALRKALNPGLARRK